MIVPQNKSKSSRHFNHPQSQNVNFKTPNLKKCIKSVALNKISECSPLTPLSSFQVFRVLARARSLVLMKFPLFYQCEQTLPFNIQRPLPILAPLPPCSIFVLVRSQPLSVVQNTSPSRASAEQIGIQRSCACVTAYFDWVTDGGAAYDGFR